ncbi:MAG TPA: mandelate racemase/muconate lactonizing enzyme family protein [Bryobacteraceae bacterium]|nr:mandelate racemase/muconate lactonizing enzyme family protein [Bryobacteraceae bacterium]
MKITQIRTWLVEGIKYNWTLIKVYTDTGLTGIGEATNWPGSPLVEAACRHVGEILVGEDPTRIDYTWSRLYRDMNWLGQGGPLLSAISAIDIALWDILGKRAGLPVYELLGGAYRKRIQLYANYWFIQGDGSPESYARQARDMAALGFTACKFDPFAHTSYNYGTDLAGNLSLTESQKQLALDRLRTVSDALGPAFPIAVETHAMLNGPTAVEMAHRIARMGVNCMWYEEPAGPEFPGAIAAIKRQIPLPVCVGERLHSRYMLRPVLEQQAADIVMPDITRCGGISEMRKMASLAETYNIPIAPHNPNGPVSTIASAHVMAATPNFFRQEFMLMDVPWRDTVIDKPLPIDNGYFHLSDAPGLGFDLIESELDKHPGVRVAREGFYI